MRYFRIEATNGIHTTIRVIRADSVESAVQTFSTENPNYHITTAHEAWDF